MLKYHIVFIQINVYNHAVKLTSLIQFLLLRCSVCDKCRSEGN